MRKHVKTFRQKITIVIVIVGIALVTIGLLGLIDYIHSTHSGDALPPRETVMDNKVPSERPVVVSNDYTVPDNEPRVIKIPAVGVEAYVQRVGVLQDGAMATPTNIHFTGWFVQEVAPGKPGLSIINGHEGGRYEVGVFKNIKNLKADDTISVQMGDLSWRDFAVTTVQSYSVADATKPLFNHDPKIDRELHLITCGGTFDDKNQTYDQRVIVVAKALSAY